MTARIRKTFAPMLTAVLCIALAAVPAQASPESEARDAVQRAVDDVLAVLRDDSLPQDAKLDRLVEVAEGLFHFSRVSKLVLGRNRARLSGAQQSEFEAEFKRHLTVTYGRRIETFSNEDVSIGDARLEHNGEVTVKTRIVGGKADDTAIDYRMRNTDGRWLIIDVIIENVSLVQNFRQQIQEIVSSKGADHLISTLREKNEKAAAEPQS
jgi:phospholipid transport system substrate-binding protein